MRSIGVGNSAFYSAPIPGKAKLLQQPLQFPDAPLHRALTARPLVLSDSLYTGWFGPAVKAAMIGVSLGFSPMLPAQARTVTTTSMPATEEAIAADTVSALRLSQGYAAMAPELSAKLIRYVGGSNREVSLPAASELRRLIKSEVFLALDADAQRIELETFLREQPHQPPVASMMATPLTSRAAYTVSDPTPLESVSFRSGNAAALRYDVSINRRTIPVFMPAPGVTVSLMPGTTGFHPTIEQIAAALAGLPDNNRRLVSSVYTNPGRNPSDQIFAQQFGRVGFISYMTADAEGLVSIYPALGPTRPSSIDFSMLHETGHVLSARLFGAHYTDSRWNPWKAAIASDALTPSAYAKESVGEDFSETLVYYISTRDDPVAHAELRALFPARFALLDTLGL
jgi:hypothetical protein